MELTEIGKRAKKAAAYLNNLGQTKKNHGLMAAAAALEEGMEEILAANQKDL